MSESTNSTPEKVVSQPEPEEIKTSNESIVEKSNEEPSNDVLTEQDLIVNSLSRAGVVTVKGGQVSFVSNDLLGQINSAASSQPSETASSLMELSPSSSTSDRMFKRKSNMPVVDGNVIDDLEKDCEKLSQSVDLVIQQMASKLDKISALSVGNIQTCSDTVNQMGLTVDQSVRTMYSLIAHAEELDDAMEPAYLIAAKIHKIKDVLSALESQVH
uniref:BLOC-1-related complex subunit 6-like n=1 Tax=Ciona intestinalis TaxID=7719 RepID=F6R0Q7_CIOIN|nr:BLOC-1-related complex subunit 6-like [Ciona intestinalis]XP_026691412.1 BLOC-1-related complex subunit 6-like [Ciona intestinalis]|eukprot:XP_018668519.2 BLOC-1-related complex subunit 6-like [Ciona intestinalis]